MAKRAAKKAVEEEEAFKDEEEEDLDESTEEDEDIYDEEDREEQLEEDEISPAEAGFVEGYEKLRFAKCKQCGKGIDLSKAFEVEIMGNDYLFCSENCAEKFEQAFESRKKKKG